MSFQRVASTVKFSNHNKLDRCLTISDIGKEIDQYESLLAEITSVEPTKPQKNTRLRRRSRSRSRSQSSSIKLCLKTWLGLKEDRRRELFNRDLSSLFEHTHIDRTVSTHWKHIPLQIGLIRSAKLKYEELAIYRPGCLELDISHAPTENQQLMVIQNPTLKHLTARDWTKDRLPPNLTSVQLSLTTRSKIILPKSLKRLKL